MKRSPSWMVLGGVVVAASTTMALGWSGPASRDSERVTLVGGIRGVVQVGGAVSYTGPDPAASPVDMTADAYCVEANAGTQVMNQPIVLGADRGVANVIVYVKEGVQAGTFPVADEPAVLDQRGCQYAPHVLALRTGQTLVIRNSDQTLHNVHASAEHNRGFNVGQPLRGLEARRQFSNGEVTINVRCDVHGWMRGYVAVFEHPFFDVTEGDGRFQLDDLPPGDYVLEAWHESLGVQVQSVTVSPNTDTEVSFVFQ